MCIFTVVLFVCLFFVCFHIGRTASAQHRWDWTLPHCEHIQLVWLLSVPKVSWRELCYPIYSSWSGASPQARDPQHLRDQEHKGGCSATSHYLHNTDSQNYWGGKALLGITKSNPLPKAGSLRGGCLGPCPGGFWWSPRNAVWHISYLCSVITLITKRGGGCLFFSFLFPSHACIHCVQCLYCSGISSGVVID